MRDKTAREQLADHQVQLASVKKHLAELTTGLADLAKPVRDLEMEWEDWFHKFRNLLARLNKREERETVAKVEAAEPPGVALPTDMNPLALQLLKGASRE